MSEELLKVVVTENGKKYEYLGPEEYIEERANNKEKESEVRAEKKDVYDWCVKQSFEDGAPYLGAVKKERKYGFYLPRYGKIYDRYFSNDMELNEDLSGKISGRFEPKKSEKKTSGNEFTSGKFYSVASSSRFAVASFTKLKNKKLDYIETIKINGKEEGIIESEFEHDTPVDGINESSRSPQLDFSFKTQNGTYFIEAKNHEILDSHKSIELSWNYKDTKAFEKLGLIGIPHERQYIDSKGDTHHYISLDNSNDGKKHFLQASDFGCKLKTSHFDFKQFLCHLMGIWSYAQNHPSEEIYFYYLVYKNELYVKNYDKKLYEDFEAEVKTIFEVFGERFPKIHFGLCYNEKYDTLKELKTENV